MCTVIVTVSSAYNFTNTGHSKYTINAAATSFYVVNAKNEISKLTATPAAPYSATLTGGKLVVPRPTVHSNRKRATFTGCSAVQEAQLTAAAFDAQDYATLAASYLADNTQDTPRYNTWFGAYTAVRHGTVLGNFESIAGSTGVNDFFEYSYDCSTCTEQGTFAYVNPDDFGVVYLCPEFWPAPPVGMDSKAGTLVHEVRGGAYCH